MVILAREFAEPEACVCPRNPQLRAETEGPDQPLPMTVPQCEPELTPIHREATA